MNSTLPSLVLLLSACAVEPLTDDVADDVGAPAEDGLAAREVARSIAPIRGGGMVAIGDGQMAVADVDGNRIVIFDPETRTVTRTIALPPRSEPFRLEADGDRLFATLLRSSEVAAWDVHTGEALWSSEVCPAPHGVEHDGGDQLFVACASGRLAVLSPETGAIVRERALGAQGRDLRDVVYDGEDLYATRFRTARVLRIDPASLDVLDTFAADDLTNENFDLGSGGRELAPRVAWRAIARPGGGVIVLHQRHEREPVPIRPPGENDDDRVPRYGGTPDPLRLECGGILHTTWTEFDRTGALTLGPILKPPAMAADIALSDTGDTVLVSSAPAPHLLGTGVSRTSPRFPVEDIDCLPTDLHQSSNEGQVVSVGWAGSARVAQTRLPFAILVDDEPLEVPESTVTPIDERQREGWAMFHETTPSGLSCASCHPEGLDDGHVWRFEMGGRVLVRRTPGFGGVISSTAPYHWNGEFETLEDLLADVLEGRMGLLGHATPENTGSLARWLDTIQPSQRDVSALDPRAIKRGQALFDDPAVGCADCHAGALLTDNSTVDVGTGEAFQVPTLIGVAGRGPWMHDGCATTLEERFDPACGGDQHGDVSDLSERDIADLVTYLKTL